MDDLRNLWQSQEGDKVTISIDDLRRRASRFEARIRNRNLRELAACVFVIAAFSVMCFRTGAVVPRIAFLLIAAGAAYVGLYLHLRGGAKAMPAGADAANSVEFLRRELERQRDLLSGVWKWYLAPFFPGMALFIAWSFAVAGPFKPLPFAVLAGIGVPFIIALNRRAARDLDREIADLDRELRRG